MTFHSETTTENGVWRIIKVRQSRYQNRTTGWLINLKTGNKYVWSNHNGKVSYMREYKPPICEQRHLILLPNIPNYVTEEILIIDGTSNE